MVCELTPSDIETIKRTKALMMAVQDIETLNREFKNSKFSMEDMATQIRLALHNKSTRPHLSPHRIEFLNKCMAQLKIASREAESEQLTDPIEPWHRPCVRGEDCEGTKIPGTQPVICREYLTAQQLNYWQATKELPPMNQLCVMCIRYIVQYLCFNCDNDAATSEIGAFVSHANSEVYDYIHITMLILPIIGRL